MSCNVLYVVLPSPFLLGVDSPPLSIISGGEQWNVFPSPHTFEPTLTPSRFTRAPFIIINSSRPWRVFGGTSCMSLHLVWITSRYNLRLMQRLSASRAPFLAALNTVQILSTHPMTATRRVVRDSAGQREYHRPWYQKPRA